MLQWEIKKLIRNVWFWGCVGFVAIIWSILLYFASETSSARYLERFHSFWSVLGSLTLGFMILAFLMKPFVLDKEQHVEEVVQTTKFGRRTIFRTRLISVLLFVSGLLVMYTLIQVMPFFVLNRFDYAVEDLLNGLFFKTMLFVWIGGMGLTLLSAFVSSMTKSHGATIIIVGILFGLTYTLRGELLAPFSFLWFVKKGVFSYLIRANSEVFSETNWFMLSVWYVSLLLALAVLTVTVQKRRRER